MRLSFQILTVFLLFWILQIISKFVDSQKNSWAKCKQKNWTPDRVLVSSFQKHMRENPLNRQFKKPSDRVVVVVFGGGEMCSYKLWGEC